MIRRLCYGLGLSTAAYWGVLDHQQREDVYGAYRSVVNSSRAAFILYQAVRDYQVSLTDIPYNTEEYHRVRHQVHLRVANRILQLSKSNKGIYLKLGQYLGNLQKVVPWQFTHVLKVLQDSAPPIPYDQLKVVIENDLHIDPETLFSSIQTKAIASASLAQVHKAVLAQNGKEVALKVQYPFLKVQSKWDILVLGKIAKFCNYLVNRSRKEGFDLIKIYDTWTDTLVQELDFRIEVENAMRTKQNFKDYPFVYIPQYYHNLCSQRLIVMEYVSGSRIDNKKQIEGRGINPKLVGQNLIAIFSDMIYKCRFIHCDAHPGNLLVREKDNAIGHQIILLDHGLYRTVSQPTIKQFSGLWVSLILQDKKGVQQHAQKLNIHEHFQYLPLIFLYRSTNSTKKLGDNITEAEKQQLREKDLANFDSINSILQDLPPQIMFIIRASNLVGSHNVNLGGTNRNRYFTYTKYSLKLLHPTRFSYLINLFTLTIRLWLFQTFYPLYKLLFGTLSPD